MAAKNFTPMPVKKAAQHIVSRSLEILQSTQRLVLAIGENHNNILNQILQAKILTDFKKSGLSPVFAVELPSNMLPVLLQHYQGHSSGIAEKITAALVQNGIADKAIATGILGHALEDEGMRVMLHTALKQNIPVVFVDAAGQYKGSARLPYIDIADERNADMAKKLDFPPAIQAQNRIHIHDARGTHLRDRLMAATAGDLLRALPGKAPQLVILTIGQTHLFGDKNSVHLPANSLSAAFTRAKLPALYVSLAPKLPTASADMPRRFLLQIEPVSESKTAHLYDHLHNAGLPPADYDPHPFQKDYLKQFEEMATQARNSILLATLAK